MFVISYNHIGHLTLPGHKQGDLTFDLTGNRGKLAGQFMRDDLIGGYSAAVQILESFLLTGLQATCFAKYFIDRFYLWAELLRAKDGVERSKGPRVEAYFNCFQPGLF